MFSLTPLNAEQGKPGYVGVWQRATLPVLPNANTPTGRSEHTLYGKD